MSDAAGYTNKAVLKVAGKLWEGWQSIEVSRSLEQIASTFVFESAARDGGGKNVLHIQCGESCEVLLDGDKVLTGWVDVVEMAHDATTHTIRVSGRSKTSDLVDCSAIWETGTFHKTTVTHIAESLAAQYGVTVSVTDAGVVIPVFTLQDGETVGEAVDRLARSRSILAYDNAEGELVMGPVGTETAGSNLVLGTNIKASSSKVDVSKRFSEYRVKGQRASDEQIDGVTASTASGTSQDDEVSSGRTRILVLHADGHASLKSCADRATWEAATRAGKSVEVEVIVQGWRQADGELWDVNELCHVRDAVIGVDATLLISGVAFRLGEDGTTTKLTLSPASGFVPEPPAETTMKGKPSRRKVAAGIAALLTDADLADIQSDMALAGGDE